MQELHFKTITVIVDIEEIEQNDMESTILK